MKNSLLALSLLFLFFSCSSFDQSIAELENYPYPYPVETFNFASQNQKLQMRYMDVKSEITSKGVIVLLHGKNFAGFYWERIAKDLANNGYRVIIPDQIGFGKSTKPNSYQYSFSQLALNTKKLLDSLKIDEFSVVGHSMGGMLALHLEQLYSKNIKRLVLINPIGLEKYLDYVEYKDPQFFYKNEFNKTVEQFRDYQKKNYYDGKWKQAYEELLEPFKIWNQSSAWPLIAWNNALTYGPIFSEDIVSKFPSLQTPTALIIGTRDKTGPGRGWKKKGVNYQLGRYDQLGQKVKELNEEISVYQLEDLGHMPQFEDYERFSKVFYKLF